MFSERKEQILKQAEEALKKAGRTQEVTLLAVSKTFPAEDIMDAYNQGQRLFGENRMQEALDKCAELKSFEGIQFHFIGHLQTNKVKYLKDNFALIHSADRIPLLEEMEKHFGHENRVQDVLVQVNVASDPAKSGVSVEELPALLEAAAKCSHINVTGFTMMPPLVNDAEDNRIYFARTRELMDDMQKRFRCGNIDLRILSMGMSDDFRVAVEEGSTLIRIGTALFGGRS